MTLLEKAKQATPNGRGSWTPYRPVYFYLVNERGFSKREACQWIAKEEELKDDEAKRLYFASKSWKEGSK